MSIITKAGSPVKGSPTEFTLNKSALAALSSVSASTYFSDMSNWSQVQLQYKSHEDNQFEILRFDASLSSPTANFLVSTHARDLFEIQRIFIVDFDNGRFEIPRSQLNTAEFDVDLTPAPVLNYINWDQLEGGSQLPLGGYTGGERAHSVVDAPAIGQDFTLVFSVDTTVLVNSDYIVGTHVYGTGDTYSGFIMSGSPTSWHVYWQGQRHNSITVSSGVHEFKMQRIGTSMSYYVDNSLIASRAATQPVEVQFVQNPVARVKGYTLSGSYITFDS